MIHRPGRAAALIPVSLLVVAPAAAAQTDEELQPAREYCAEVGGSVVERVDLAPLFRSDVEDYPPVFV